jgi:LPS sulfotransferase NodH
MSRSYTTEQSRTSSFAKNSGLERLLDEVNSNLWVSEKALLEDQMNFWHPLILVMGPPRSGSTLFIQWLANTGLLAYPTNLLSRFYKAPIIGAKIQLLLTDPRYKFRDELGEFVQQAGYRSENGKTKGVLAPNEFWYFWRRFLVEPNRDVWTDDELRQSMKTRTLLAELAGMMQVFQKPFAAKGMLFNYNIPFLDSVFDNVLFVHVNRDRTTNVGSVLDARKRQLGSVEAWYSFDIPEKSDLIHLSPEQQVAGQVNAINSALEKGLKSVDESRKMEVQYEHFCHEPANYFQLLLQKLGLPASRYNGPETFQITR